MRDTQIGHVNWADWFNNDPKQYSKQVEPAVKEQNDDQARTKTE